MQRQAEASDQRGHRLGDLAGPLLEAGVDVLGVDAAALELGQDLAMP
jgi:hypothetical protein